MKGEISKDDQKIVAELFSNLEVAHDHMATACGLLSRLSRTLKPDQLFTIIKASIRPLIQLKALATLETPNYTGKTMGTTRQTTGMSEIDVDS